MPQVPVTHRWSIGSRAALGLAFTAAATLLRLIFDPLLDIHAAPHLAYLAGVVFAAWFGRRTSGLVATIASLLAGGYLFSEPRFTFAMTPGATAEAVMFLVEALAIVWAVSYWRQTDERRRRSEEALHRERELLQGIVDNIPVMLVIYDARQHSFRLNREAQRLLGWSSDEANDGDFMARVYPDPAYRQQVSAYMQSLQTGWAEWDVAAKDGSSITSSWANVRLADDTSIGIGLDVREQKQAEAALRESEGRFRAMADGTPVMIWVTDAQGRIEFVNLAYCEFFGATLEQVQDHGWQPLVHPEDSEYVTKYVECLRERKPYVAQGRVRRHDGEWRWLESIGRPRFSESGAFLGMAGSSPDITARKQAELDLGRQAQELAEANRVKDEFIATMSHELRTPLNAILGWSHLLLQRNPDQAMRPGLEAIQRSAQAQATLVDDVLDVSRIVTGRLRLTVRVVDLRIVIDAAMASIRPAADAKGIALTLSVLTEEPVIVGDPDRLQQVVWNLLSNAVKFTPKGGSVDVSVGRVDSRIELTVSDTGIGIKPDFLPRLFQRFAQADSSTSRRYTGLGLGLAIVRHLVELHGGSIAAESEGEGKGARFRVRLPVRSLAEAGPTEARPTAAGTGGAHAEPPPPPVSLAGMALLVVDDDAEARTVLQAVLREAGAEVTLASSAGEALACLESQRFNLLVSDIGMPDVDGYWLINRIRERGLQIPAIALTAYGGAQHGKRVMGAGYHAHLSKPVTPERLLNAIAGLALR